MFFNFTSSKPGSGSAIRKNAGSGSVSGSALNQCGSKPWWIYPFKKRVLYPEVTILGFLLLYIRVYYTVAPPEVQYSNILIKDNLSAARKKKYHTCAEKIREHNRVLNEKYT
jgi:hypothetical protein